MAAGDLAGAVTALGTTGTEVLTVAVAGISVFLIARGVSWVKGALA